MLFGDKTTFAIECELYEEYCGEWMNGEIYYWIGGEKLGWCEHLLSLRDSLSEMRWPIYDRGNRKGEMLCELTPEEAFSRLDKFVYGDEPLDINKYPIPEISARFQIDAPLVASASKIYLIQCGDDETFIYKTGDSEISSFTLAVGIFDSVLKQAYEYLDEIHEREMLKAGN